MTNQPAVVILQARISDTCNVSILANTPKLTTEEWDALLTYIIETRAAEKTK